MEEGEREGRRGRGMVGRPFLGKSLRLRGRFVAGAEEMAYLSRGLGVVPEMLQVLLIEPWNQERTIHLSFYLV